MVIRFYTIILILMLSMSNVAVANEDARQNYLQGLECLKQSDVASAVSYFQKAANEGDVDAQCEVAVFELYGCGVKKDESKALETLQKLAKQGNSKAQYVLARCYNGGIGVEANPNAAVKWCEASMNQDNANAGYLMAIWLRDGDNQIIAKDSVKAVKIYREIIPGLKELAEQCDLDAICNLAVCYGEGLGVDKNLEEEIYWFTKAAELGYSRGLRFLGYTYNDNQEPEKAFKWWSKGAEIGYADCQLLVGYCYEKGLGVEQDYTEAMKWYRLSAAQGNSSAQNNLGNRYYNGEGVAQDYTEAVKWYRKAAEQGDSYAQNNLGYCYYNGRGVAQDYPEAVKWYRLSAAQGNSDAQLKLGFIYFCGDAGVEDVDSAKIFFQSAAKQNNKFAYYCLGLIGESEDSSEKEIVENYRTAAVLGHKEAQEKLISAYLFGNQKLEVYNEMDSARFYMNLYTQQENGYVYLLKDFGIDIDEDAEKTFPANKEAIIEYCNGKIQKETQTDEIQKYHTILALCSYLEGEIDESITTLKQNVVIGKPYLPGLYLLAMSYEAKSVDGTLKTADQDNMKHLAFKYYMRYIIIDEDNGADNLKKLKGQALYRVATGYKWGYHVKPGVNGYQDDHQSLYGDVEESDYYLTHAEKKYKQEMAKINRSMNDENREVVKEVQFVKRMK